MAILDLRLGQDNGLDLLRDIRSRTDVPVIILADERRDDIDPVVGLELGADDCVTTPFGIRELLARVRAVLRRNARRLTPPRDPARGRCRFGGWQLDRRSRRLTNPDRAPVPLTKAEYALLLAFLDAPQRPLTREHLLQATRVHEDVFDRSRLARNPSACTSVAAGAGRRRVRPAERWFRKRRLHPPRRRESDLQSEKAMSVRAQLLAVDGEVIRNAEIDVTEINLNDADFVLGIDFLGSQRVWISYGSQQLFVMRRI